MTKPTIILSIEHTDQQYAIIDQGEDADAGYRYCLADAQEGDHWSNDRNTLIREAVRRLDAWDAEIKVAGQAMGQRLWGPQGSDAS